MKEPMRKLYFRKIQIPRFPDGYHEVSVWIPDLGSANLRPCAFVAIGAGAGGYAQLRFDSPDAARAAFREIFELLNDPGFDNAFGEALFLMGERNEYLRQCANDSSD